MATVTNATLVLKDKNGNVGYIHGLSATDITKLQNAVNVTTVSGLPLYSNTIDYEPGYVVRSGTKIYQALIANGPSTAVQPVTNSTYWAEIGSVAQATTSQYGTVQLADAAAITAGTAGRVVDAAQLKAAVTDIDSANITVSTTTVDPSTLDEGAGAIYPAADHFS